MNLGEYMRKTHPPPLTYLPPQKKGLDVTKFVKIQRVHIETARAFVFFSMLLAVILPGKWAILASLVGNFYWLYKIR